MPQHELGTEKKVYFDWEHAIFGNPVFSNTGRFQKSNDLYWMQFQADF
jgi:hypothetical protein